MLFVVSTQAQPLVTGFERFHADDPKLDGGALLFNELGCANCHGAGAEGLPKRQGAALVDIVDRVNADWVRDFLAEPQLAKDGTMMPAMFADLNESDRSKQVEAVTHYLMSLTKTAAKTKTERYANAERGSALFHETGCAACHAPNADHHPVAGDPKPEEFETKPVPFPDLRAKYSLESLNAFLQNPSAIRPDGRMPHFQLDSQDALDIACHLMDHQDSDPRTASELKKFTVDPKQAAEGEKIVTQLNCAACHTLPKKHAPRTTGLPAQRKSEATGCLSPTPAPGRPFYDLSEVQRAAQVRFVNEGLNRTWPAPTTAAMTLQAFNCLACHDRDGAGGPDAARNRYFVGDEGIADSGRLPPPLTGIGQKLRPDWLIKVLKGDGRVRPYVKTQMPKYASHAESLALLLAEVDAKPDLPKLTGDADIEAGRKLVGIQGGMNCVTCHVWGDKPSLGIQALDISALNERLQPEWFRDYLLNPQAYRPGTLMPPLWPGGVSMVKDVCEGDTEKQIASIWKFIGEGEGLPGGYPEIVPGAFELKPTDRAIIQRTFMKGVGPHAILVGFPGGVNLAYDALKGRPAKLWRGRFFDAYSTWFVRAAPFEEPLGDDVLDWPSGSESDEGVAFGGYRLDKAGNPTFVLTVNGKPVEDHYEAVDGTLKRTVTGEWKTLEHPIGATVTEADPQTFIYSWK